MRRPVCVVLAAVLGCFALLALGGCAANAATTTDLEMASVEATPAAFASVETTECPEFLACVERADAPLPVVRRATSTSSSSSSASTSDEMSVDEYIEAHKRVPPPLVVPDISVVD